MQVNAGQIKTGNTVEVEGRKCRVTSAARFRCSIEIDGQAIDVDDTVIWYQWSRSETRTLKVKSGDAVTVSLTS